jgi:hypothetical protein
MSKIAAGSVGFLCAAAVAAHAQTNPPRGQGAAGAPRSKSTSVSEVVVTSRADLLGTAVTASQGSVSQEELRLRPAYRVGELLESVPGLVVTLHSGEGKAPQYLARGFNLDHGTDIANFIDDAPINRPTNAHGQGYADLNFLMPEVLGGLEYTKGPYFPSVGDFGDLVSVHLHTNDEIPNQISSSVDTYGGYGGFVGGTHEFGPDDRLMGAFEGSKVNGPYTPSSDFRKIAAVLRYSHGTYNDGYDVTAMYFHGFGNFSTDQPLRAIQEGLIGRYGLLDPTDGNRSERLSLTGRYAAQGANWTFVTSGYYVRSRQTLWNDFTHFFEDPVNGDQEQQDETRDLAGGAAAFTYDAKFGAIDSRTTVGVQGRYDGIYVDRRHTHDRTVLDYCEALGPDGYTAHKVSVGQADCTADLVTLGDVGLYVENSTKWTNWLRTDVGVREEFYRASDLSLLPGTPHSLAPYTQDPMLFQPKGSVVFGPWAQTEFYISAGRGFHSDDIRGVSGTVPVLGIAPTAGLTPLLVKADGEEIGIRTDIIPKTHIQIAVYNFHLQSEQVYDQDEGEDSAGAPSIRDGVEFSAEYRPFHWLELNTDLAFTHARYTDETPAQLLNNFGVDGYYIPLSPAFIGSFGVIVDDLGPWYGGLQIRMLGAYPLTPDNAERDAGYTETNVNVGYKFSSRLKAQFEIFNLFDVKANGAAFYYTTRLANEPAIGSCVSGFACPFTGIADHQVHPLEPISARFSITAYF